MLQNKNHQPQRQIFSGVLIAMIAGGYAVYIAFAVKEKNAK
jgi:hypothetical protein